MRAVPEAELRLESRLHCSSLWSISPFRPFDGSADHVGLRLHSLLCVRNSIDQTETGKRGARTSA
eukprot:CAMPEP_0194486458 /NCGR_PEP_ID=MMETSP0253-20130528/7103_1 /TAXON_ID=2966 /ORGANISM="Noctiluca scintillans" /LENGTH=64 /DNA_ID=CAMNT_0039326549 /DNA_START=602 /DNA_END=793 /DNA_ORIENTATION=-